MTPEEQKALHKMLPRIPGKFKTWAEKQFDDRRTFFYTKKQGELHVECVHCGAMFRKEYTAEVEEFLQSPKGAWVKCPKCKVQGQLVSKKNRRNAICRDIDIWYGQKLPNGGWILRFFRPVLMAVPDKEKSYERFVLTEMMRYYFPVGMRKKLYKEFWHSYYDGEWNGTYCFSTMGYSYNGPTCGFIYPETWENMKGTVMAYSMTQEAIVDETIGRWNTIADWQQAYIHNKWFEALFKAGLTQIISDKMNRYSTFRFNGRAKTPWDYLKIEKKRFKELTQQDKKNQMSALLVYRIEKLIGNVGEYAQDFIEYGMHEQELSELMSYSTPAKIANYIRKQEGLSKSEWAREYRDYLRMKKQLGYDMTDSINLFPHDLIKAHNDAVIEIDSRAAEERKAEVEAKFGGIKERFKGADKVYHYESGAFIIRPAMSASEIVDEGRYLHHCVGGDGYLKKHEEKRCTICFLRHKNKPDTPYITVELINGKVEQWHSYLNDQPEKKRISRWLKKYTDSLDPVKLQREAKNRIKHKTAV